MDTVQIEGFSIIGIAVRTTNENGQAAIDIPQLWDRFFKEGVLSKIRNKFSDDIYSVYTEYEGDYTKPYTTLLGCRVPNLDIIPDGLTGKTFAKADYIKYVAKGKLNDGIVYQEWVKIWALDIPRAYIADFEVYGAKSQDPDNAEVEIFIGVK